MAVTFSPRPPAITHWNRLEPRPRSNDFGRSLAAEVRDPAWFLARQWQMGELEGEDAGSPAYLSVTATRSSLDAWAVASGETFALDPAVPLERQVLGEPFDPDDLTLQVEIGQMLEGRLDAALSPALAGSARDGLRSLYPVAAPTGAALDPFNPLDVETRRFLTVCAARAVNGAAVYVDSRDGAADVVANLVAAKPDLIGQETALETELDALVADVRAVWGDLDQLDPRTWDPVRMEYAVTVSGATPDADGRVTLAVRPDAEGAVHWSSLDVAGADGTVPGATTTETTVLVPSGVRFRGMPAPRFWDFESSDLALPDVKAETRDVSKLLALDFMLVHGEDWFLFELEQPVGTLNRVDTITVTDVFGGQTEVAMAGPEMDLPAQAAERWVLFRNTNPGAPAGLAGFFAAPPSAGAAIAGTRTLEEVRLGRDEMANMVWAVERATASRVGRARPGSERDAAVEAIAPSAPDPSPDATSLLRYLVQTRVPVHYVPFVGVRINTDPNDVRIELEKAANVRRLPPGPAGQPGAFSAVKAAGRILNPPLTATQDAYRIPEDEVPRAGVTVERVVFRSRWIDGSTHLWIARRKRTGSGEIRSGLAFDQAQVLPVPR